MECVECVKCVASFEVWIRDRTTSIFVGVDILKYTPNILFRFWRILKIEHMVLKIENMPGGRHSQDISDVHFSFHRGESSHSEQGDR